LVGGKIGVGGGCRAAENEKLARAVTVLRDHDSDQPHERLRRKREGFRGK